MVRVKRHAALQDLSRDHQQALLQARHIRWLAESHSRARPADVVRAETLSFWHSGYAAHLEEEDAIVLPALQHAGLQVLAAALLADHHDLRARIAQVGANEGVQALVEFGQRLHDHVRFEERVAFEQLQGVLDEHELAALGAQSRLFREQRLRPCGPFHRTCAVSPHQESTHG